MIVFGLLLIVAGTGVMVGWVLGFVSAEKDAEERRQRAERWRRELP